MNGRMYDPRIARFLSPDPVIQDGTNGQNYNRYSYCLNNPMKYIDPSGYYWEDYDYGIDDDSGFGDNDPRTGRERATYNHWLSWEDIVNFFKNFKSEGPDNEDYYRDAFDEGDMDALQEIAIDYYDEYFRGQVDGRFEPIIHVGVAPSPSWSVEGGDLYDENGDFARASVVGRNIYLSSSIFSAKDSNGIYAQLYLSLGHELLHIILKSNGIKLSAFFKDPSKEEAKEYHFVEQQIHHGIIRGWEYRQIRANNWESVVNKCNLVIGGVTYSDWVINEAKKGRQWVPKGDNPMAGKVEIFNVVKF